MNAESKKGVGTFLSPMEKEGSGTVHGLLPAITLPFHGLEDLAQTLRIGDDVRIHVGVVHGYGLDSRYYFSPGG